VQPFTTGDGLFQAWDGSLKLLAKNGLLDRVMYVDVLNEYPFWTGFEWIKKGLAERADLKKFKAKNPDVHVPDLDAIGKKSRFNPVQKQFYNSFLTGALTKLKKEYPQLDFFASLDSGMPLDDIDLSAFGALDYHLWFNHNREMRAAGLNTIAAMPNDNQLESAYADVKKFWAANRTRMIEWISGRIKDVSEHAARFHIPPGNTEGWGPIFWMDHPALDWEWTKEAAGICVPLAREHAYKFICTSNFTHPQHVGLWEQVKWHRKITSLIRA
jgi:hypothetical protein